MREIVVVVMVILLSACATMGQESLNNKPDDWPPIEMTKAELLGELGPPNSSTYSIIDGKSIEILSWVYAHAESNPALFIPVVGLFVAASGEGMSTSSRSLAVTFQNEKITSRSWSRIQTGDQRPRTQSMPNY